MLFSLLEKLKTEEPSLGFNDLKNNTVDYLKIKKQQVKIIILVMIIMVLVLILKNLTVFLMKINSMILMTKVMRNG